jgi:hypothetical protein
MRLPGSAYPRTVSMDSHDAADCETGTLPIKTTPMLFATSEVRLRDCHPFRSRPRPFRSSGT